MATPSAARTRALIRRTAGTLATFARLQAKRVRTIASLEALQRARAKRKPGSPAAVIAARKRATDLRIRRTRALRSRTALRIRRLRALQAVRERRIAPRKPLHREGIDYTAMAPQAAKALLAKLNHGTDPGFVGRYVSTPGNPKNMHYDEQKALNAFRVASMLFMETTANRSTAGFAAGHADARSAQNQHKILGRPDKNADGTYVAIFGTVDFDARPAQVHAYLVGFKSVLGRRAGIYGSYAVVKYAMEQLGYRYGCQAYAWSGGRWHKGAQIQQYLNTAQYDHDRTMAYDCGLLEPTA